MTQTGQVIHSVGDKVILHVEKVGNLSKEVLEHARKKGVEIVDNISGLI